jgi:hypothetical protein
MWASFSVIFYLIALVKVMENMLVIIQVVIKVAVMKLSQVREAEGSCS